MLFLFDINFSLCYESGDEALKEINKRKIWGMRHVRNYEINSKRKY